MFVIKRVHLYIVTHSEFQNWKMTVLSKHPSWMKEVFGALFGLLSSF